MGALSPNDRPANGVPPWETLIPDDRLVSCTICGALVPAPSLPEHLLGDEAVLRIISQNNPTWARQECIDYYIRTYRPG